MSESHAADLGRPMEETFADARRALQAERRALVDEQQAFETFANRVGDLAPDAGPGDHATSLDHHRGSALERVRDAYRETVMSVPHYPAEYGESLSSHVEGECSEAVAAAMTDGSRLSAHVQRSLVGAAREAIRCRGVVVDTLDEEARALDRGEDRTGELVEELSSLRAEPVEHAEFDSLRETRERLDAIADRCRSLAIARQETLQSYGRTTPLDVEDFGDYVYGDCEHVHPILSQFAGVAEQVEWTRRGVDRRLAQA